MQIPACKQCSRNYMQSRKLPLSRGSSKSFSELMKMHVGEEFGLLGLEVACACLPSGNLVTWSCRRCSNGYKTVGFAFGGRRLYCKGGQTLDGPTYPEKLWSLHLWTYSKPSWIWPWTTCSSWPCLSRGTGLGDLTRSAQPQLSSNSAVL